MVLLLLLALQDSALQSQRARELMAAGRYAEAIPIYVELVKAIPNEPRLHLNLGLARQMAGRCKEAIPAFETASRMDPALFPAWASAGACYLDLGQPARAVAPLEKAVALAPRERMPRQMLGDALFATGRPETAARHLREACEIQPDNPRAWYALGKAYEALSQRAFEQLYKTAQGSAWWLALVAETRLSQKSYAPAFTLYREALNKAPNLRGGNAAIAEIYRNTGHPDWAAAAEKNEQGLPPPDCARAKQECAFRDGRFLDAARGTATPESLYWQSRAYNRLAAQAFGRLAQLPPSVELHRLKAQVASARGSHIEAANELRAALKLAPRHPELRVDLAMALHKARDHQGTLAVLDDLVKQNPDAAPLNFMYGDTLLELQQVEKAIPYLERAVRAEPSQAAAQAALGIALARAGQLDRALPHLEAGAAADTDGRVHFQLGRAYQAAGQTEQAARAMQRYQELQREDQPGELAITPP